MMIPKLIIFFWVTLFCQLFAGAYFFDFPDDGTREAAVAVDTYHEHALKSLDYYINVSMPGYLRKSITNERLYNEPDGKHLVIGKYSFQWMEGPPFETENPLHFCLNANNRGFFINTSCKTIGI